MLTSLSGRLLRQSAINDPEAVRQRTGLSVAGGIAAAAAVLSFIQWMMT